MVNKPTPREVDEMARCLRLFITRRPMTQSELAVVFGCSRARIARIETMALRKIRAVMEGKACSS